MFEYFQATNSPMEDTTSISKSLLTSAKSLKVLGRFWNYTAVKSEFNTAKWLPIRCNIKVDSVGDLSFGWPSSEQVIKETHLKCMHFGCRGGCRCNECRCTREDGTCREDGEASLFHGDDAFKYDLRCCKLLLLYYQLVAEDIMFAVIGLDIQCGNVSEALVYDSIDADIDTFDTTCCQQVVMSEKTMMAAATTVVPSTIVHHIQELELK